MRSWRTYAKQEREPGATPRTSGRSRGAKADDHGRLKIGDDWNTIRITALSQSNPLKAIAEFVENSIGAHANRRAGRRITRQLGRVSPLRTNSKRDL
jgi:hypothetical protein